MPSPKSPPATRRSQATKGKAPPKIERGPKGAQINRLDALGADWLCEQIIEGRSFRSIAAELGMNVSTLTRWVAADADRERLISAARVTSGQTFDEKAVEVLEGAKNAFGLAKARELASHYRWRSSKVNPRQYGDRTQVDGPGEGGAHVFTVNAPWLKPAIEERN